MSKHASIFKYIRCICNKNEKSYTFSVEAKINKTDKLTIIRGTLQFYTFSAYFCFHCKSSDVYTNEWWTYYTHIGLKQITKIGTEENTRVQAGLPM